MTEDRRNGTALAATHRGGSVDTQARGSAELVQAAAGCDSGAWTALVERHGRMLASIARRHGLNEADVADVTQTVWLRLFEHIDRLRQPERVASWLATTTRHECMRVWRQRSKVTLLADPGLFDAIDDESETEPKVHTQDRDVQLRAAVATLSHQHQAMLGLLMSDPSPGYRQVSAELGIPVGSIGPTRQRCLRALHATCVDAGIGPG